MNLTPDTLLHNLPVGAEAAVKLAASKFDATLQRSFEFVTGLRLNVDRGPRARRLPGVVVEVTRKPWSKATEEKLVANPYACEQILADLLRCRLTRAIDSLKSAAPIMTAIFPHRGPKSPASGLPADLKKEIQAIGSVLLNLPHASPFGFFREHLSEDYLGMYFPSEPHLPEMPEAKVNDRQLTAFDEGPRLVLLGDHPARVELYWAMIAIVSEILDVSVEMLTAVVLAHEYGHVYSHLGLDEQGIRWNTAAFLASDHALKEGLAQFYTHQFCNRAIYDTGLRQAYERLRERQAPEYRRHMKWLKLRRVEQRVSAALKACRAMLRATICDFEAAFVPKP